MLFGAPASPLESPATVGAKALRAAFAAAAAARLDPNELAASHGLALSDLDDADLRVSHDRWTALFQEIERRTGDPAIGLRLASKLPMGHWDTVDYMIAASATIGEAISRIERYFSLISTAVEHRTAIVGDEVHIRRAHKPGASRSRSGTELAVAMIVRRLRALSAERWTPSWIGFAHEPATSAREYEREFDCDVRFEQREDVIALPARVLSMAMAAPAPELCAVLERHAKHLIERLPRASPTVIERVTALLATELHAGPPSLARVARRLNTSPRTLQRRLDEADTSFTALVDDARRTHAVRYVRDPRIGLGEVGYLLGFAEPSAFSKAFRRWTGESPSSARRRARAELTLSESATHDAR
jgi:AraC-like DNA-binding protein